MFLAPVVEKRLQARQALAVFCSVRRLFARDDIRRMTHRKPFDIDPSLPGVFKPLDTIRREHKIENASRISSAWAYSKVLAIPQPAWELALAPGTVLRHGLERSITCVVEHRLVRVHERIAKPCLQWSPGGGVELLAPLPQFICRWAPHALGVYLDISRSTTGRRAPRDQAAETRRHRTSEQRLVANGSVDRWDTTGAPGVRENRPNRPKPHVPAQAW